METIIGAKSCTWQLKLTLWPTKPTIGRLSGVVRRGTVAVVTARGAPRSQLQHCCTEPALNHQGFDEPLSWNSSD